MEVREKKEMDEIRGSREKKKFGEAERRRKLDN